MIIYCWSKYHSPDRLIHQSYNAVHKMEDNCSFIVKNAKIACKSCPNSMKSMMRKSKLLVENERFLIFWQIRKVFWHFSMNFWNFAFLTQFRLNFCAHICFPTNHRKHHRCFVCYFVTFVHSIWFFLPKIPYFWSKTLIFRPLDFAPC